MYKIVLSYKNKCVVKTKLTNKSSSNNMCLSRTDQTEGTQWADMTSMSICCHSTGIKLIMLICMYNHCQDLLQIFVQQFQSKHFICFNVRGWFDQ